jgi:glycosyltransferase involved in cell wall biosynthesis
MMKFSIITPSFNSGDYIDKTIRSIVGQRRDDIGVELLVIDGGSTDTTHDILARFHDQIDYIIIEPDRGPAHAINKGLRRASGAVVAWLNADDLYYEHCFEAVASHLTGNPRDSFCFGRCLIIDEKGTEIRRAITRFKEMFFPISSRFTFQVINYISQPALFFRKSALDAVGFLREDMVAAWDYDFFMRLWLHGHGGVIDEKPVAAFRWHEQSISGRNFHVQFQEELAVARQYTGAWSPQTLLHHLVRFGIVGAYSLMAFKRDLSSKHGNPSGA